MKKKQIPEDSLLTVSYGGTLLSKKISSLLTILMCYEELGKSYEMVADNCYISHNTVKYRIKKLMDICKTETKKDCLNLVKNIIKRKKLQNKEENHLSRKNL